MHFALLVGSSDGYVSVVLCCFFFLSCTLSPFVPFSLRNLHFQQKKKKDMGASFIVLVPKTEGAMSLKIRPLSFLRSVCKILATVLTN